MEEGADDRADLWYSGTDSDSSLLGAKAEWKIWGLHSLFSSRDVQNHLYMKFFLELNSRGNSIYLLEYKIFIFN